MNINVIIPAYKTSNIIDETIHSILNQNIPNLKIYVGIDGDDEKYSIIENVEYYKSNENVGTYIISNTLVKLISSNEDYLLFFDSDDIMPKDFLAPYISYLTKINMNRSIMRLNYKNNGQGKIIFGYKQIIIKKQIFDMMGGYYDFRVGQDDWFLKRLSLKKIQINTNTSFPFFYRKIRSESLTKSPDTGMGSYYRKNVNRESQIKISKNLISDYKTVNLFKYE